MVKKETFDDPKKQRKKLKQNEQYYRLIAENSTDMISKHGPNGVYIYASPSCHSLLGFTADELVGQNAYDFFHPDDLENVRDSHRKILKTETIEMISSGNLEPYKVIGINKNGDKFPIEIHAKISEYHGKKIRMAAIRDITRYKQAEDDTRKALEYAAEQSKHALIGEVAGKMAHDFNNVLMGIMGNAQLALLNCDDENTKKRLESIYEFSERGKEITNNLISFSKDQEPKPNYFKVENKIELVLKMLEKDLAGIEVSRNYKRCV